MTKPFQSSRARTASASYFLGSRSPRRRTTKRFGLLMPVRTSDLSSIAYNDW